MYFTCKCLNVSIKSKGNEPSNFNFDDLEPSIKEQAEAFFNNSISVVKDVDNIKQQLPGLMQVENVGAWTVHRCYNCLTYTHAVHQDYGAALVLVNANMTTSEAQLNNLKASHNYSPVFGIVIDHNKAEEFQLEPQTKFAGKISNLPSDSRLALATLEQQLEEAIHQQAHSIDKRIREFTRQQYEILDNFKERAHLEHHFLARLICSEPNNVNCGSNDVKASALQTVEPNKTTSATDVANTTANCRNTNTLHSPDKLLNSVFINGSRKKDANNYDGEPLFLLEGMDDGPSMNRHTQISNQESDTDDSGNEGIHIPHNHRGGHATLAKSLPVTVPAFHSFNQRSIQDDDDEQISRDPMDPHNIQASIKALAKSVHGDTVFGDLPRPRFSTQI